MHVERYTSNLLVVDLSKHGTLPLHTHMSEQRNSCVHKRSLSALTIGDCLWLCIQFS